MLNWNWDDLRFVAVLAEAGTIAEAARRLNVNRTTVLRRITAFEDKLSYRLFARDGWGLEPLPEAQPILEAAREIGDALTAIQRKTSGSGQDVSGDLTMTTTDSIFLAHIGEVVSRFQTAYPKINLHVSVTTSHLNLGQREAEVAVRPSRAPPEHLVGRRVCDLHFGAYASRAYLNHDSFRSLADHDWIGMTAHFKSAPTEVWMAEHVPREKVRFRADSFIAIAEAARWGRGIALLPCAYGNRQPDLERVENLIDVDIMTGLWVLTHPDFRSSPRVRVLMDFVTAELASSKHVYLGES
ncbi:MAG: LysR family transcriptional regulator [Henriciella sp.]|uniref:LysR family transcriptional regulator n=1 Tax=Henriciella sp. TaxID=1968823 RepID=UPI003C77C85B